MVFIRSISNELLKEGLIEELVSFNNLSENINDQIKEMEDFTSKFDCIFKTWFFNNNINVQLTQNEEIHKIFHNEDLVALLKVDDLAAMLKVDDFAALLKVDDIDPFLMNL